MVSSHVGSFEVGRVGGDQTQSYKRSEFWNYILPMNHNVAPYLLEVWNGNSLVTSILTTRSISLNNYCRYKCFHYFLTTLMSWTILVKSWALTLETPVDKIMPPQGPFSCCSVFCSVWLFLTAWNCSCLPSAAKIEEVWRHYTAAWSPKRRGWAGWLGVQSVTTTLETVSTNAQRWFLFTMTVIFFLKWTK